MQEQEWQDYELKVRKETETEKDTEVVFFRDGIMDAERFGKHGFRPLFILKEVHDKNGCKGCSEATVAACTQAGTRVEHPITKTFSIDFCRCPCGFGSKDRLWTRVAELNNILEEAYGEPFTEHSCGSAIINLKKLSGGPTAGSDKSDSTMKYQKHANEYEQELKIQIDEINPTHIVCCGSFEVHTYDRHSKSFRFVGHTFRHLGKLCKTDYTVLNRGKNIHLSVETFTEKFDDRQLVLYDINHPSFFASDDAWEKYKTLFKCAVEKSILETHRG